MPSSLPFQKFLSPRPVEGKLFLLGFEHALPFLYRRQVETFVVQGLFDIFQQPREIAKQLPAQVRFMLFRIDDLGAISQGTLIGPVVRGREVILDLLSSAPVPLYDIVK